MTPDVSFSIANFGHTAIQYTFNCKFYSSYNVFPIFDLKVHTNIVWSNDESYVFIDQIKKLQPP